MGFPGKRTQNRTWEGGGGAELGRGELSQVQSLRSLSWSPGSSGHATVFCPCSSLRHGVRPLSTCVHQGTKPSGTLEQFWGKNLAMSLQHPKYFGQLRKRVSVPTGTARRCLPSAQQARQRERIGKGLSEATRFSILCSFLYIRQSLKNRGKLFREFGNRLVGH